jgi:hypothetical protein
LKPEFSRDKDGRAPNESFLTECNRLLTGFQLTATLSLP